MQKLLFIENPGEKLHFSCHAVTHGTNLRRLPLWSIPFVVCNFCVDKHLVFTLCGSYPLWSLPFVVATLCGPHPLWFLFCSPYPLWSYPLWFIPIVLTNMGSKSTIPEGRVGRVVGWLDNMGIRPHSAPIGVGVG